MTLLIRNLSQVATPLGTTGVRGVSAATLFILDNPVIVIENGMFAFVGSENQMPPDLRSRISEDFDARRATALPGFVDTHTHLPFAGYRESEFNRRLQGETYQQIAALGGGIASTVRATRAASHDELSQLVTLRTGTMALHGTTSAEAKSGYGLSLRDELKQLTAIRSAAASTPVRLVATCLAAHDFPPECSSGAERAEYVRLVCEEILPEVARAGLARYNDVFVEEGVFTREQGEQILRAGAAVGLRPRVHADEFSDQGGAALAVEVGAASADHLMHVSEEGIARLAASDTVANLLPCTSFFLMTDRYAPARAFLERGGIISLSTDCNPGSSMTESMQAAILLGVIQMKLTVEEAITAATINGAFSLGLAGETGSVETGKSADLMLLDAPSYLHLVYHFGVNLVRDVFRDGAHVVKGGTLMPDLRP
ncbi:MAG TPA: imidazolonepropionase [Thermoanaerobaculia bacterium]|nr:imidazolonepropionase [Thermoanaerobaculia bacterium]